MFDSKGFAAFWLLVELEWAELQKRQEFYDPDTCADMDEPGCTYPDCHNCGIGWDDEEEDW